MALTVAEVMSRRLETVEASETLQEAAEHMRSVGVGALAVTDEQELVGFLTDRDLVVRCMARGMPLETPVREAMTAGAITVIDDEPLEAAELTMEQKMVRRLVVVDRFQRPVGLISLDDLATLPREASRALEVLRGLNVP